jgi:hypothetical protein
MERQSEILRLVSESAERVAQYSAQFMQHLAAHRVHFRRALALADEISRRLDAGR